MKKKSAMSKSVRISNDYYKALKQRAEVNHRPISSELEMILSESLNQDTQAKRKPRDYSDILGIVKDLPPSNYSERIDEILYGAGS